MLSREWLILHQHHTDIVDVRQDELWSTVVHAAHAGFLIFDQNTSRASRAKVGKIRSTAT